MIMKNSRNELILSSSSIEGTEVRTLTDEKIGSIKDVMLKPLEGEVLYFVLSVDTGFLNLDSKYFAIPAKALEFDLVHEVIRLDVDKERLENSPGFDKDNWPKGPQVEFINRVNTYYDVPEKQRL
jgi:sporulation protein YlmC with PRC-barrel domain